MRKVARAVRRSWPPPVWPTMSFKCWGLKPSGPPAEPFGNDLMALITSSTDIKLESTTESLEN